MRLAKFIAHAGVCSRRHAEELIEQGHVTVNGSLIETQGTSVDPTRDEVQVDDAVIRLPEYFYYIVNKPSGYISSTDGQGKKSVLLLLPNTFRERRITIVGRLDRNTEGLLLMTDDGDLAHRIMHPSKHVTKSYDVIVRGELDPKTITTLEKGVEIQLDEGPYITAPCTITHVRHKKGRTSFTILLSEGKKRQIRRMMDAAGHPVTYLKRTAIGPITLENLGLGEGRLLDSHEIHDLKNILN